MYIAHTVSRSSRYFQQLRKQEKATYVEKEEMVAGYARMFRWSPVSHLVCQHSSPLTLRVARKPVKPSVTTLNEAVWEFIHTATQWQLQNISIR